MKEITTWALEHFLKLLLVNTVHMQIIALWFSLCYTQYPDFLESQLWSWSLPASLNMVLYALQSIENVKQCERQHLKSSSKFYMYVFFILPLH